MSFLFFSFFVFSKKFIENQPIQINHVSHKNSYHSKNTVFDEISVNRDLIDEIIVNLRFHPKLNQYASDLINTLNLQANSVINVIHLRVEEDAIPFWGGINKINNYNDVLQDKYINLIRKYIQPTSDTINIILSMSTDNKVIDFMKENNYAYIFTDKNSLDGREVNAIIDMLLALNCNGTFIGNVNPENYHGSSFSAMLYSNFKKNYKHVKNVLIDIDHIFNDELVC